MTTETSESRADLALSNPKGTGIIFFGDNTILIDKLE